MENKNISVYQIRKEKVRFGKNAQNRVQNN